MPPKKGGKKKTASGYRMPDHLPAGTLLNDLHKKQWCLGNSIGVGGFGEIYLAAEGSSPPTRDTAKYVVKIEPKENGPLFVEMHFYIQVGKPELVKGWGKPVNIPILRGQGSHNHKDDVYRFLVIDRFGVDLDKTFLNGKRKLADSLAGTLAVQIINSLEYIHSKGYTHNDVKAANLLLGLGADAKNIYLVDFGLCVKYIKADGHKEYKHDPRKAHDGTIEYLSRDAHIGCTSRRSDLEVLCYNLYHWHTGTLPWLNVTDNPKKVQDKKEDFMGSVSANVAHLPPSTQNLFNYVAKLKFEAEPDYDKCRGFFNKEMKQTGGKIIIDSESPTKVNSKSKPAPVPKASNGRKKSVPKVLDHSASSDDDMFSPSPPKKAAPRTRATPRTPRTPAAAVASPARPARSRRGTPLASAQVATVARQESTSGQSALEEDDIENEFSDYEPEQDVEPRRVVKPKKKEKVTIVKKFKEMGCQTSPGFVAKVSEARRATKIDAPDMNGAALKPAKPSKSTPKRKLPKQDKSGSPQEDNGLSNPNAAMLAIMKRREEIEAEKAAKKRKK